MKHFLNYKTAFTIILVLLMFFSVGLNGVSSQNSGYDDSDEDSINNENPLDDEEVPATDDNVNAVSSSSRYPSELVLTALPIISISVDKAIAGNEILGHSVGIIADSAATANQIKRVSLNTAATAPGSMKEGDLVRFELSSMDFFLARIKKANTEQGEMVVSGSVEGSEFGFFAMSTVDGQTMAVLRVPEHNLSYSLIYDPAVEQYYLFETFIDQIDRIEGSPPLIPEHDVSGIFAGYLPAPLLEETENAINENNDYLSNDLSTIIVNDPVLPATIDVMVVYTPAARNWALSHSNINNVINIAMAIAQTALDNSGTGITMPLVHRAEVNYTESGSGLTDLDRLTETNDGHMDIVHTWRDTYGADLVALFADVSYGGIGWLPYSFPQPALGFSISRVRQVTTTANHIHEMGHNMGAHHSRLQNHQRGPNSNLNPYSSAHRFMAGGTLYSTLMAYTGSQYYTDSTDPHRNMSSTEIYYFSNPSINFNGVATGVDGADGNNNARTLRESKHHVAGYRTVSTLPSRVTLRSPANNADVAGTRIIFRWNAADGGTKYQLQIRRASDNSIFRNMTLGDVTQWAIANFPANNAEFRWRVRAGNNLGWGEWSVFRNFRNTSQSPPPQLTLRSPTNNANELGTRVVFSWNAADGGTKYQLQVRNASDNSIFRNPILGNVTQLAIANFPANGDQYRWRVRAGNAEGWGQWSAFRNFRNTFGAFNHNFNTTSNYYNWIRRPRAVWGLNSQAMLTAGQVNRWVTAHQGNIYYRNFDYSVRMRRTNTPGPAYPSSGIVIRAGGKYETNGDWYPSYRFHYNNLGNYSIWRKNPNGSLVAIQGWTASNHINKNGWNTLRVLAANNNLRFFINGNLVMNINDSNLPRGLVGVMAYRGSDTPTSSRLLVDWARLSRPAVSSAASMEAVDPMQQAFNIAAQAEMAAGRVDLMEGQRSDQDNLEFMRPGF